MDLKTNLSFKPLKSKKLFKEAVTHKSYAYENIKINYSYERLEFLGDTVVNLVVGDFLFRKFPKSDEGKLTKIRSQLVCEKTLRQFCQNIHLDQEIKLGKGALSTRNESKILSDVFESYIGALFIDSGRSYQEVYDYIEPLLEAYIPSLKIENDDDSDDDDDDDSDLVSNNDVNNDKDDSGTKTTITTNNNNNNNNKIYGPNDCKIEKSLDPINRLQTWAVKRGFESPKYEEIKSVNNDDNNNNKNNNNVTEFKYKITIICNFEKANINYKLESEGVGKNKAAARKNAAENAIDKYFSDVNKI